MEEEYIDDQPVSKRKRGIKNLMTVQVVAALDRCKTHWYLVRFDVQPLFHFQKEILKNERIFEVRFFAWCGRACARGGAGTTQKEDPGYVISLRSGKTPISVRAGSDRITISRSPRRGLTKLAIDRAQHSHDEVRSENHTHKRAPGAGAKAQLERMMAPEARTTLTI
ncbi:unnamed protein product [Trichogramma brassicae]|uniref:Uncharacterized protein n=1 Tax=Trichogramma brassicae TaxID=86971 RepID=A0A6H5IQI2_9HYME|nr:unnamed protein product [Trichogramma brassicae]